MKLHLSLLHGASIFKDANIHGQAIFPCGVLVQPLILRPRCTALVSSRKQTHMVRESSPAGF